MTDAARTATIEATDPARDRLWPSLTYRLLWPLALISTIIFASSNQVASAPGNIPGIDKIAHILLFGLLATHFLRYRRRLADRLSLRQALIAIGITFLFGVSDELQQARNPFRTFEYWDMAADLGGATLAVVMYQKCRLYRRILEWDVIRRRSTSD